MEIEMIRPDGALNGILLHAGLRAAFEENLLGTLRVCFYMPTFHFIRPNTHSFA